MKKSSDKQIDKSANTKKCSNGKEQQQIKKPVCKNAYVYIIKCADETLYSGWTTDVQKRIKTHNAKKGAKYTKSRLPVKLVYFEKCTDKSAALKREHEIKTFSKVEKQQLISAFCENKDEK